MGLVRKKRKASMATTDTDNESGWKLSTVRLRPEMRAKLLDIQKRRNGPGKPTTSQQVLFEEAVLLLFAKDDAEIEAARAAAANDKMNSDAAAALATSAEAPAL